MENGNPEVGDVKPFRTRFVYNSQVWPANIEAALANRGKKHLMAKNGNKIVKTKVFTPTAGSSRANAKLIKENESVQCKFTNVQLKHTVKTVHDLQQLQWDTTVPDKVCQVGMTSCLSGVCHKRSQNVSNTCAILQLWEKQTDFKFGFIPCSEQELPVVTERTSPVDLSFFSLGSLCILIGNVHSNVKGVIIARPLNFQRT